MRLGRPQVEMVRFAEENSSQQPALANQIQPDVCAYLKKRSKMSLGQWEKRCFILTQGNLQYYTKGGRRNRKQKKILLHTNDIAFISQHSHSEKGNRNAVRINIVMRNGESTTLVAPSEVEALRWCNALNVWAASYYSEQATVTPQGSIAGHNEELSSC